MKNNTVTSKTCPNLAAEILCHNKGSVYHFAKICSMSEEEMYSFLIGDSEIDRDKFDVMIKNLPHCREEYLKNKKLSYYDMSRKKHHRKVLALCRNAKYTKLGPIDEIMKRKIFLRAWYNKIMLENMKKAE